MIERAAHACRLVLQGARRPPRGGALLPGLRRLQAPRRPARPGGALALEEPQGQAGPAGRRRGLIRWPRPPILDRIGRTPLVPLRRIGRGLPVPVLAKCEHLNPGGSVKDRIALAIVDDAERRGVASARRHPDRGDRRQHRDRAGARRRRARLRLVCVMPEKMSRGQAHGPRGARRAGRHHAQRAARRPRQLPERRPPAGRARRAGSSPTSSATPPTSAPTRRPPARRSWSRRAAASGAFVAGAGTGGTITGVGPLPPSTRGARACASCSPTRSARGWRAGSSHGRGRPRRAVPGRGDRHRASRPPSSTAR